MILRWQFLFYRRRNTLIHETGAVFDFYFLLLGPLCAFAHSLRFIAWHHFLGRCGFQAVRLCRRRAGEKYPEENDGKQAGWTVHVHEQAPTGQYYSIALRAGKSNIWQRD
jgi:hypothetical protein